MVTVKSEFIVLETCKYYNVNPRDIFKDSRKRKTKEIRHAIQYLHTKYTKLSLGQIGELSIVYGRNRPHTHASVLNARDRSITLLNSNPSIGDKKFILDMFKIESRLFTLRERVINKKDSDNLKIVNMRLTHELINLREKIQYMKYYNPKPIDYSDKDLEILNFLKTMNYIDKEEALHILETKKKVRENMTHQKLRTKTESRY